MSDWTGLDWIMVAGVAAGIVSTFIAMLMWKRSRNTPKTSNEIRGGSNNRQSGGAGTTENKITDGDHNIQSGSDAES